MDEDKKQPQQQLTQEEVCGKLFQGKLFIRRKRQKVFFLFFVFIAKELK
jgi:hypothetical protein